MQMNCLIDLFSVHILSYYIYKFDIVEGVRFTLIETFSKKGFSVSLFV